METPRVWDEDFRQQCPVPLLKVHGYQQKIVHDRGPHQWDHGGPAQGAPLPAPRPWRHCRGVQRQCSYDAGGFLLQPEAHLRAATGGPCLHDVCIVIDYYATDGQSGQSSSSGSMREQRGESLAAQMVVGSRLVDTPRPGDLMRHAWALLSGPVKGSARCLPAVRLEGGAIQPAVQAPIPS